MYLEEVSSSNLNNKVVLREEFEFIMSNLPALNNDGSDKEDRFANVVWYK